MGRHGRCDGHRITVHSLCDALLLVGSTLRLTRLATMDNITEHLVIGHLRSNPRAHLIVEMLDCPFCIGWWLSLANCTAYALTTRAAANPKSEKVRKAKAAWRFLAGALTLSYAVGHISSRLDG